MYGCALELRQYAGSLNAFLTTLPMYRVIRQFIRTDVWQHGTTGFCLTLQFVH